MDVHGCSKFHSDGCKWPHVYTSTGVIVILLDLLKWSGSQNYWGNSLQRLQLFMGEHKYGNLKPNYAQSNFKIIQCKKRSSVSKRCRFLAAAPTACHF